MYLRPKLYRWIFFVGLPLSCGFIGEFLCLFAAFDSSVIIGVLALCGGVLSVVYSLYL